MTAVEIKVGCFRQGRAEKSRGAVVMLTWVLFYMLAVFCSARRSHTFPLYSESSLVPPADLIQKLIADEEGEQVHFGDRQRGKDLYPFELQQSTAAETLAKGGKDSLQQENIKSMVDDLKTAVLKLAAADSLRSHGLPQPDQRLPKTNKRACFWKYCVTN